MDTDRVTFTSFSGSKTSLVMETVGICHVICWEGADISPLSQHSGRNTHSCHTYGSAKTSTDHTYTVCFCDSHRDKWYCPCWKLLTCSNSVEPMGGLLFQLVKGLFWGSVSSIDWLHNVDFPLL